MIRLGERGYEIDFTVNTPFKILRVKVPTVPSRYFINNSIILVRIKTNCYYILTDRGYWAIRRTPSKVLFKIPSLGEDVKVKYLFTHSDAIEEVSELTLQELERLRTTVLLKK